MKKVEKEFLNSFADSTKIEANYLEIKDKVNLGRFGKVSKVIWKKWALTAMYCLMLVVLFGGGIFAITIEAKEYQKALNFFNTYELPMEDLTRGEIKAVYKDITTNSFKYKKTSFVINNAFLEHVSGYQIPQEEPTPEEMANLWNYLFKILSRPHHDTNIEGIKYRHYVTYLNNGEGTFEKSVFEKYDGTTLLWKQEFTNFYINDFAIVKDLVVVYGFEPNRANQSDYPWIAAIDSNGTIKWQKRIEREFNRESIEQVVSNGDNTMAIISRGDLQYLGITHLDFDGNIISFYKTDIDNYAILNATRFQDGYLVHLADFRTGNNPKIVKVSKESEIEDEIKYEFDNSYYFIADMIEFNNKIYLSAYAVPKVLDGETYGGRNEIANILNYLYSNEIWEISSEELTPMVRSNYTALLLVCDNDSGTPTEFYSVEGSLGSRLTQSETGELLWNVESITSIFFSPATSSFTLGGVNKVYQYSFDSDGNLIWQKNTGEVVQYRR